MPLPSGQGHNNPKFSLFDMYYKLHNAHQPVHNSLPAGRQIPLTDRMGGHGRLAPSIRHWSVQIGYRSARAGERLAAGIELCKHSRDIVRVHHPAQHLIARQPVSQTASRLPLFKTTNGNQQTDHTQSPA